MEKFKKERRKSPTQMNSASEYIEKCVCMYSSILFVLIISIETVSPVGLVKNNVFTDNTYHRELRDERKKSLKWLSSEKINFQQKGEWWK